MQLVEMEDTILPSPLGRSGCLLQCLLSGYQWEAVREAPTLGQPRRGGDGLDYPVSERDAGPRIIRLLTRWAKNADA